MLGLFGAVLSLLCLAVILASVYRWSWFWRAGPVMRINRWLGPLNTQRLLVVAAVLLLYLQVRSAADSLFGSLIGQLFFLGGSGLLLWTAYQVRRRQR
jgi:hypothetical protein